MTAIVNIEDLRKHAKRRLPKIFFDYIDGAAFSDTTALRNHEDFDNWCLIQRVLALKGMPDLSCEFLGTRHTLPIMLGPVGFLGLYRGRGEILCAEAAKEKGIPLCLSTFSIASLATLQREVGGTLQFQLYMDCQRSFVEKLVESAEDAEVETLFYTADTAVTSVRERDVRNGFRAVRRLNPTLIFSMMQRPLWCWDMWQSGIPSVEALANYPEFGKGILEQASNLSGRLDSSIIWEDMKWLRKVWKKRLVIKGILSSDDAIKAIDHGADAIVVSNHGGRQLDFANSTISILPEIRKAVGKDYCVMIDGGFRRGSEVVIALALGASGVLLGRAYAFGLAADGRSGVEKAIEIFAKEISITMKLMGVPSVDELKQFGDRYIRQK